MKQFLCLVAAACLLLPAVARADEMIATVQQKLKDGGFYYGEVTGQKDADTTAAIRRYQIRNGLQITGELNAETQKSLGVKGALPPAPKPRPTATPVRTLTLPPRAIEETRDPRDEPAPEMSVPLARNGLFAGTLYENASLEEQQSIILRAQALLARQGMYRNEIDGIYGPDMAFALRAYQSRFRMTVNGRLDPPTLAAMGLMPGQHAPGMAVPRRRVYRPARTVAPNGEPIYEGR